MKTCNGYSRFRHKNRSDSRQRRLLTPSTSISRRCKCLTHRTTIYFFSLMQANKGGDSSHRTMRTIWSLGREIAMGFSCMRRLIYWVWSTERLVQKKEGMCFFLLGGNDSLVFLQFSLSLSNHNHGYNYQLKIYIWNSLFIQSQSRT